MTAQLATTDFGDALTAPENVRRLLKRAAVQQTIEVLRGNLVVASTESLGGARNVEWAQSIVSEASAKIEPGLFVVVVGENEATWDTSWSEETERDGSGKLNDKYESFGSRMQAFGFACLREAMATLKEAGKEIREQSAANAIHMKKLAKAYGEAANEPEAVAIERMKNEAENERIETAVDIFQAFKGANAEVVGSAKRTEAIKDKAAGGIPAIAADIISKLPADERDALLATDAGQALKGAQSTADLIGAVRAVHKMTQTGELEISEETAATVANILRKIAAVK